MGEHYPRLKELRKEFGYTQAEVSETLGVSMNHYGKYERGEVDIPVGKAMLLAKLYCCSLDYLFELSDVRNDNDTDIVSKKKLVEKFMDFIITI